MHKARPAALALAFIGVAASAQAADISPARGVELHNQLLKSLEASNDDAVAALFSEQLVYIHPNGMVVTKQGEMDILRGGPHPRYAKVSPSNTTAKSLGDLVVVTGDVAYTALPRPGAAPAEPTNLRITTTWAQERDGKTRAVGWHVTTIAAPRP